MVKNLPAVQEIPVQSLGLDDPLEKEMATRSSILAWEIPWTEEPGGLQSMGSQRVRHDLRTSQQQSCRKLVTLQMILVHRRINEFCPVETIDCCPVVIDQF